MVYLIFFIHSIWAYKPGKKNAWTLLNAEYSQCVNYLLSSVEIDFTPIDNCQYANYFRELCNNPCYVHTQYSCREWLVPSLSFIKWSCNGVVLQYISWIATVLMLFDIILVTTPNYGICIIYYKIIYIDVLSEVKWEKESERKYLIRFRIMNSSSPTAIDQFVINNNYYNNSNKKTMILSSFFFFVLFFFDCANTNFIIFSLWIWSIRFHCEWFPKKIEVSLPFMFLSSLILYV